MCSLYNLCEWYNFGFASCSFLSSSNLGDLIRWMQMWHFCASWILPSVWVFLDLIIWGFFLNIFFRSIDDNIAVKDTAAYASKWVCLKAFFPLGFLPLLTSPWASPNIIAPRSKGNQREKRIFWWMWGEGRVEWGVCVSLNTHIQLAFSRPAHTFSIRQENETSASVCFLYFIREREANRKKKNARQKRLCWLFWFAFVLIENHVLS